jgi:hypothetical protein
VTLKKLAPYLWITAFVLGDVALFSSRALYLDEPFFIALARTARSYGLFFEDTQWVFFGRLYPMFGGGSHPPAVTYYLTALYSVFGGFQPVLFRLFFSLFGVAAAFGFYGLARRRCAHPLAVTLLFVASPAFFVMTPTLMMDIPLLGFLLLGLRFYFAGRSVLAAVCFSLAALTGYTALIPLGCLFVSALLTRQPRSSLLAIAAAPCVLGAWLTMMVLYYGKSPLTPVVQYFISYHSIGHNILATPSFLGGVTVVPWLFVMMLRKRTELRFVSVILPLSFGAALLLSLFITWKSIGYGFWYILLASSGIALLLLFGDRVVRLLHRHSSPTVGAVYDRPFDRPLDLFLMVCFPAVLLFFVGVAQFASARYLLPAMPALYLALFDRSSAKSIAAVGVPTLLLSLGIATADYRFVNSYPTWVSNTIAPLQAKGFRILGAGESGLRFYLEERAIPTLSATDLRAADGDLIVRHSTLFKYGLAPQLESKLDVLSNFELNDRFPLRTFSHEAGAGFHGSSLGIVPYTFSRAPYDRLEIVVVSDPRSANNDPQN